MPTAVCPSDEDLLAFLFDPAGGPPTGLADHLNDCPSCQGRAERLVRVGNTLAGLLRRPAPATTAPGFRMARPESVADPDATVDAAGPASGTWAGQTGYEVLGELGRGGMGVVYKARHPGLGRVVALKMIRGDLGGRTDRFRAEAGAAARLQHPNVVQVYEVGEHDGRPYIALEHVDGPSLDQALKGKPLPPREAAGLVETVARAIHYAHTRGVVHRDLKPANILLAGVESRKVGGQGVDVPDVTTLRRYDVTAATPKVTDFGIAKRLDAADGPTRAGELLGTPAYMAPEQAGGASDKAGPAVDVWALGVVLYECLTGRTPFQGTDTLDTLLLVRNQDPVPPRRLLPNLPRDLEAVCLKCLQKEPAKRYATADALADDLRRFLDGRTTAARPAGPAARGWKWARRNAAVAALLAVVAVGFAGGFAAVAVQWRRAEANLAEADTQRRRAEDNLTAARTNLGLARRAVDDYLTRVGENRLMNQPGLQGLRADLLRAALPFYEEFDRRNAADPAMRAELARAHHRVGQLHFDLSDHRAAAAAYDRALAVTAGVGPGDPDALVRARALNGRAQTRQATADPAGARADADEALALVRAADPADPDRDPAEAEVLQLTGMLEADAGRVEAADRAYDGALAAAGRAAAAAPGDRVRARKLALTLLFVGHRHAITAGRAADADATFTRLAAVLGPLAADPADLWAAYELAQARVFHAEFLGCVLGRWADDRRTADAALATIAPLARANPLVADFRSTEGYAHYQAGYACLRQADYRAALDHYRAAAGVFDRLTRDFPDAVQFRDPGLAGVVQDQAEARRRVGDLPGAAAAIGRVIGLKEQSLAANPTNYGVRLNTAMARRYTAAILAEAGKPGEAAEAARWAEPRFEELLKEDPTNFQAAEELGRVRISLGDALRAVGDRAGARDAYDRAAAVLGPAAEQNPTHPDFPAVLATALARAAAVRREMGQAGEAAKLWERAAKVAGAGCPPTDDGLLVLATVRAAGVPLASGPTADERAATALDALRRSVAAGLAAPHLLKNDPELAPLRGRPEWGPLLAEVEKRSREAIAAEKAAPGE